MVCTYLPMLMMVVAVALIRLLQVGPAILSSGDIGDNYYDTPLR